jgi:hypothetical protein
VNGPHDRGEAAARSKSSSADHADRHGDGYEPVRPINRVSSESAIDQVTVTFEEMEDQEKIGISLPSAAKRSVRWWENESTRDARQSRAWMDAGWEVAKMDLSAQRITFRRRSSTPR